GNEDSSVNPTSWATLTPKPSEGQNVAVPGQANATENPGGTRGGKFWIPAECDVPLRKGWFYHANEKPKTTEKRFDLYLKSVGRGAALDLGLAPDTRGQLHNDDVVALKTFGDHVKNTFATNLIGRASSKAVNVRGYNSVYSAKNLLDGKPDTYWAT